MVPEILYTPRYENDLVRIYKYSARKLRSGYSNWVSKNPWRGNWRCPLKAGGAYRATR